MLQYLQITDDPNIYDNLSSHQELLDTVHSGECVLIVGSTLLAQICTEGGRRSSPYLRSLLEGMVEWCVKEGIIDRHDIIEDFRKLIHRESLTLLGYKIEEYLADKSQQQQCLREVLHHQVQVREIYQLLAQLPFRGYITTAYDTFIETVYFEVRHSKLAKFYKSSIQNAIEAYQNKQPFILKLYGDIDNPGSIALSHRVSKGLALSENQSQLWQLLSPLPVLFIGFEEGDPDLEVLKGIVRDMDVSHQSRTYWIVTPEEQLSEPEVEPFQESKRTRDLSSRPSKAYTKLVDLLGTLAPPKAITEGDFKATQLFKPSQQTQPSTELGTTGSGRPITIFIPYSYKDKKLLEDRIEQKTLTALQRQWNIQYSSSEIDKNKEWKSKSKDFVYISDIIILLVTANFVAVEYCYSDNLKCAIDRHKDDAYIVPILFHASVIPLLGKTPFAGIETTPEGGKAVNQWSPRDLAFQSVNETIIKALKYMQARL